MYICRRHIPPPIHNGLAVARNYYVCRVSVVPYKLWLFLNQVQKSLELVHRVVNSRIIYGILYLMCGCSTFHKNIALKFCKVYQIFYTMMNFEEANVY